jgi:hypothetical protein
MDNERLEAIGQKGEVCIIIAKTVTLTNGQIEHTYSLASGERLIRAEAYGDFTTTDGRRSFKLRTRPERAAG